MFLKRFEQVILVSNSFDFPIGTKCIFNKRIDSFDKIYFEVIVIDEKFYQFLFKKNISDFDPLIHQHYLDNVLVNLNLIILENHQFSRIQ